jgi:tetratricopeptide (TPR) repeat protein
MFLLMRQSAQTSRWKKLTLPLKALHVHSWILIIVGFALMLELMSGAPFVLAQSGRDPEIQELTDQLAQDPDNVELLILRGQVYRSNGKLLESLQDMDRAWLLKRDNREVALERALTLSVLHRYQEAEAALDDFLQNDSDPKRVMALAERAHIRANTGRIALAIADFTAAIHLQPTIELYLIRGQLQESLGKLNEAEAGYHEGLARLGDAILLKKSLIRVHIGQQHYDEALALIDEEVARAPVKTRWYLERAELLARMGKPEATRLAYERALSEVNRVLGKRSTAMQLVARAKIYHAMGRTEEAKRDLRAAKQKAPRYSEADDLLKKLENQ